LLKNSFFLDFAQYNTIVPKRCYITVSQSASIVEVVSILTTCYLYT